MNLRQQSLDQMDIQHISFLEEAIFIFFNT